MRLRYVYHHEARGSLCTDSPSVYPQTQLLACLQWLGEFQVLACVPLTGSVPVKDVADLSGVPEDQLSCTIRMAATAGFLHEPQPQQVAHTALSAAFVNRPSLLDAAMFLASSAAPAALNMAEATQRYGASTHSRESAYSLALDPRITLQAASEQRPKLRRQWAAYLHNVGEGHEAGVIDVLTRMDWLKLGNACAVEVGAPSCAAASALLQLYPALRFIVQIAEQAHGVVACPDLPAGVSSRIVVQKRVAGTSQPVTDASVYIFRLPLLCPSPSVPSQTLPIRITGELRAHLGVLRANPRSMLILTTRQLPDSGTIDPKLEALARLGELSVLQLTNERALRIDELVALLEGIEDGTGRLAVIKKMLSSDRTTVALVVKHQSFMQEVQPAYASENTWHHNGTHGTLTLN